MEPVLRARGLAKIHEDNGATAHALRGVDLDIADGEFVAIMGASGCGKSTLLHLLGGLERPTSGELRLGGQRVDRLSEKRWAVLRRRQIGFVFQFFNLLSDLSVADNVELPALVAGVAAADARARRNRLLDELGLSDRASALPSMLSGGQQQRVAIARALINRPAVLLADEPTGNLDSASAQDVLRLLKGYHRQGQAIVLVTHDARVAASAQRVITMRDGLLTGETRLSNGDAPSAVLTKLIQLEV